MQQGWTSVGSPRSRGISKLWAIEFSTTLLATFLICWHIFRLLRCCAIARFESSGALEPLISVQGFIYSAISAKSISQGDTLHFQAFGVLKEQLCQTSVKMSIETSDKTQECTLHSTPDIAEVHGAQHRLSIPPTRQRKNDLYAESRRGFHAEKRHGWRAIMS